MSLFRKAFRPVLFGLLFVDCAWCAAQDTPEYVPPPLPPAQGTVLFSGKTALPQGNADAAEDRVSSVAQAERNALTFTAYDLNVHLTPAQATISAAAQISIRNDGAAPLTRIAVQLSSALHWESFSWISPAGAQPLHYARHRMTTDADHTGEAEEAVVTLPQPLLPGAIITLGTIYTGEIHPSGERLVRLGAPQRDALLADWDQIGQAGTFLRGFANVLWYPVAANPVLLGDGAKLFEMAGEQKLRQSGATIRLRLTVEYVGAAPIDAFFNGRHKRLETSRPVDETTTADSPGVATAEFAVTQLGFRTPNLFVSSQPSVPAPGGLLEVVPASGSEESERTSRLQPYADAAKLVQPLLTEWLGPVSAERLTIFEHDGQPFEDQSLLLTPLSAANVADAVPTLVHSLSHTRFRSDYVWLDEGVPQFISLLWLERTKGRSAAMADLQEQAHALALAESRLQSEGSDPARHGGESLLAAKDDVYYRNKAAAVLFMLRSILGEENLKAALQSYSNHRWKEDPTDFEHAVEAASKKDLAWFFDDWVYHDRGLPDLTIVSVSPRELPATDGRQAGWLIAVEVANEGGAAAEVPVTIRSGVLTRTEHLRIGARSRASTRIVFEGMPEELIVNDGSVPEAISSSHTRKLDVR